MKYEMIFGDEALFDGCDENAVAVIDDMTGTRKSSKIEFFPDDALNFETVDVDSRRIKLAMRRIIKEPKRWTWEDKKVGRLPEVGCDIQYIESQKRVSVVAINANEIVLLAKSNGSKFFVLDPDSLLEYYNPIETPADKAQRLEDEFVNFVLHRSESKINSSEELVAAKRAIKLAYKLQLSGELAAPKVGE